MFEKDTMQNLHWSLDDIEEADYQTLMEVLNTSEEDKLQNPEDMFKQWQSLS